eukprot:TRINITY_DN1831_c0_g1_i1.p1 TRINITY_DN1831_c0_g1~~TRINITY_DN1831_c0_g1_i1.p1  ORF type:complete len:464 (+),score=116.87 TRINITY_DN1831_c0_g1_i1:67-1392(+)
MAQPGTPGNGMPMTFWGEMRCHIRFLNWVFGGESRRKVDFTKARKVLDDTYGGLDSNEKVLNEFPKKERLAEFLGNFETAMNKFMYQSFVGARGAEVFTVRNLSRLKFAVDFFKKHPETLEKKIEKPIIIIGLHRTGSSMVQRLLSLDPKANESTLWKLTADPLNDTYKSACASAQKDYTFDAISPSFQKALVEYHPMQPDLPDEDVMLLFPFYQYPEDHVMNFPPKCQEIDMYMKESRVESFQFLKRWLQMWSVKENKLVRYGEADPDRHWVLKNPSHGYGLEDLIKEFPDARLVFTHRVFAECAKSLAGLKVVIAAPLAEKANFDSHKVGQNAVDFEEILAKKTMDFHKAHPERNDFHITHGEVMNDPIGTVRAIYESFSIPFTEEYHELLKKFVEETPPVPSKVKKCLSHFGLTEEMISTDTTREYDEHFVNGKGKKQ